MSIESLTLDVLCIPLPPNLFSPLIVLSSVLLGDLLLVTLFSPCMHVTILQNCTPNWKDERRLCSRPCLCLTAKAHFTFVFFFFEQSLVSGEGYGSWASLWFSANTFSCMLQWLLFSVVNQRRVSSSLSLSVKATGRSDDWLMGSTHNRGKVPYINMADGGLGPACRDLKILICYRLISPGRGGFHLSSRETLSILVMLLLYPLQSIYSSILFSSL